MQCIAQSEFQLPTILRQYISLIYMYYSNIIKMIVFIQISAAIVNEYDLNELLIAKD